MTERPTFFKVAPTGTLESQLSTLYQVPSVADLSSEVLKLLYPTDPKVPEQIVSEVIQPGKLAVQHLLTNGGMMAEGQIGTSIKHMGITDPVAARLIKDRVLTTRGKVLRDMYKAHGASRPSFPHIHTHANITLVHPSAKPLLYYDQGVCIRINETQGVRIPQFQDAVRRHFDRRFDKKKLPKLVAPQTVANAVLNELLNTDDKETVATMPWPHEYKVIYKFP